MKTSTWQQVRAFVLDGPARAGYDGPTPPKRPPLRPLPDRLPSILLLAIALASAAGAQDARVRVTVRDTAGTVIPFALVQPANGASRAASDSGVAEFRLEAKDSLRFVVRRIGYEAFEGWVPRAQGTGDYMVRLMPLVQSLKATRILARSNVALARTGFYDRMERNGMGATAARFITPEELDLRNPARISQMLQGENFVKVDHHSGRAFLVGRAMNCPMTILLDGRRLRGTMEEVLTADGIREMRRRGGPNPKVVDEFMRERLSIDEIVISSGVVAIEIYASMAGAPAKLQQNASTESCGIVALWTGSRR